MGRFRRPKHIKRSRIKIVLGALVLSVGSASGAVAVAAAFGGDKAPSATCDAPSYDGSNFSIHCVIPPATSTATVTNTVTRTRTRTVTAPPSVSSNSSSPPSTSSSSAPPPTDTSSSSGGDWRCAISSPSGNCGAYDYGQITGSNGYNTYVGNNCWADPQCQQTIYANDPGDWQVVSTEPAHNTGVMTYPNVQQLTNNWNGSDSGCSPCGSSDVPISALSTLSSTYAETTPHNSATIAQFAWDIWLNNNAGHPSEIMVWVDNSNRGSGGATLKGTANIGGHDWTLYQYGGGEIIWSLGAQGTFAQQGSGTIDLLALLHDLQTRAMVSPAANIGQVDVGWEICSTGGSPETFVVSAYSLKLAA